MVIGRTRYFSVPLLTLKRVTKHMSIDLLEHVLLLMQERRMNPLASLQTRRGQSTKLYLNDHFIASFARFYLPMMGAELERSLRLLTASDLVDFLDDPPEDFRAD